MQQLERQVAASESKLAQQTASVDNLESRMRQMTPRLPREFHAASSSGDLASDPYVLTREQQASAGCATSSGITNRTEGFVFAKVTFYHYQDLL